MTWDLSRYLRRPLPPKLHMILTVRDVGQDPVAEYELPAEAAALGPIGRADLQEIHPTSLKHPTLKQYSGELVERVRKVLVVGSGETFSLVHPWLWGMEDGRLLEPDPDWAALSDALARMQAGDTYADVADDRGRYLRLPVEAVSIGEDRPYQEALLTSSDPIAGIPFVDAVKEKLMAPSSRLILVAGAYGSNITTQLKRFAWLETRDTLDRVSRTIGSILSLPESGQGTMFLPLFAGPGDLRNGKSIYPTDPMRGLVLHKLADPWPGLIASTMADVLKTLILHKIKVTTLSIAVLSTPDSRSGRGGCESQPQRLGA